MYCCLTPACLTNSNWLISLNVLNTSFTLSHLVVSTSLSNLVSFPSQYTQSSNCLISCTEPPSAIILSQVSLLLIPTFLNAFSNSLFFLMKVPFAVCSVNTFAAQGSIPGETLPANLELDTVGATALR